MYFILKGADFSNSNIGKIEVQEGTVGGGGSTGGGTSTYTFTISPTPSSATVTLTATGYTQSGNSITVPGGTTVSYTVSASGYVTVNSSKQVWSTQTLPITLNAEGGSGSGGGGGSSGSDTTVTALVFTEGTLDSATGTEKTATGTYRSDYVAVDASSVVKFTSAKTMIVFKYDSSKKYTGRDATDWYSSSEVPVSDAAYIRVLVKGVSAPPTDGTVTRTSSSGGNNGGGSGGSENLGDTTFGASKTPVTIISDFSGFTFENGKVVSTSAGSTCDFSTGSARAASTTQILSVSGGKTYTFTPTISGLQYALIEFTDAPCTVSTLNKSGKYGQAWSSDTSGTIHSNTKYLTINFNRGSGSFSASELEALKNAIKIN